LNGNKSASSSSTHPDGQPGDRPAVQLPNMHHDHCCTQNPLVSRSQQLTIGNKHHALLAAEQRKIYAYALQPYKSLMREIYTPLTRKHTQNRPPILNTITLLHVHKLLMAS